MNGRTLACAELGAGVRAARGHAASHRIAQGAGRRHIRSRVSMAGALGCAALMSAGAHAGGVPRNILLIIMDDVGIDQLESFNPHSPDAPHTPVLDAIAEAGIKFTDCWAMPDCSPSRAALLTGRYPMRTGVMNAILPPDLPRSQVSPYEITIPMLLADVGYDQHYVGKLHLGDPSVNPAGSAYSFSVGLPSFDGTPYGGPALIDFTVGGQMAPPSGDPTYSCGFPVDSVTNAPAICSCGFADGTWLDNVDALDCLDVGGVPLVSLDGTPIQRGSAAAVAAVDFGPTLWNGYYTMPRAIVTSPTPINSVQRGYATSFDVDRGLDWLASVVGEATPWFLTVGFEAIHTPYQPSPYDLRPEGFEWPSSVPMACGDQVGVESGVIEAQRVMTALMLEAIDIEVGRLLTESGLAEFEDGTLTMLEPNTTIILMGDNGTYYPSVRFPYDPTRSKATPYQTGVLVPLAVAGASVVSPGRSVDAMVNITDLFVLIGELAGIDVHAKVPPGRIVDGHSMLPYLADPATAPIRTHNFAQLSQNQHRSDWIYSPCLLTGLGVCTDGILFSAALCVNEGGQWLTEYVDCCALLESQTQGSFDILPIGQMAITDGRWKLVRSDLESCVQKNEDEFFDLWEAPFAKLLGGRGIDYAEADLLSRNHPLTPEQAEAYLQLKVALALLLDTVPPCPGDGNLDGRVNLQDIADIFTWWGSQSSVYDFNGDLVTDGADLGIILVNWDRECMPRPM